MSVLTDWLAEEEEKKKRLGGQRPSRTPPRSPQNLVESSPYARMREIDPNKQVEEESSGSLGPIDFLASGAYHFANSAFMGLPDYGIAAANEGWTPYDLEETNGWGKVGGIIGEAAGFLIPIGYAGKLAALPFKALSKSSTRIMGSAAANAGTKSIGESVARAATRTTGTVRAKNFIPGVKDARRRVTKKGAQEALNEASEKSIRKTMNKAVDEGSSRRGLFRPLFPDKPKKWLPRTFSHTSKQSVQLQKQIERNVRAGLKNDFKDVAGMTDDMINTIANNFVKGLGKGEHLNTAGAWITHGLGAGTPGWLRARVAGYSGRFADMMLSFGIYNTVDEILHRQLEDGYVPRSAGEITKSTAMFAAVLPLIEAIPGGISGAMTIKNYKDIAGIMKKPKYGEMSKHELTTYYDYIKYKMPGRKVGKVSDSKMRIRNKEGLSDGVSQAELVAGLDDWYLGARKDFRKMFVGEEAKNFAYSLPRMVAGGMYFGGAINEAALAQGDIHQGFFGDEFMHHLKEDPASVATHMLTGVFFTRNRKPLSRDVKGRFPHQVHYSEEYQGKLAMLREMGFDADILELYFNSFSQTDIRKGINALAYQNIKSGREITGVMNKAMAKGKAKSENGKYDSELDAVEDKNLIEGYDIWSASKSSEIISNQDKKSREIDGRDMLEFLTKSERQELNREIGNITIRQRADGTFERISDSNWNTIRSEIFDKTILNNHYQFFFDYLKTIGEMGPNAAEIIIENEGTDEARIINLPKIQRGQVTDVAELNKYEYVANKLVKEGKAKWAEGTETEIKAEDFNKEGKWDKLAEETHRFEDNYARSILGEDVNLRIDFNNLDVVWDNAFRLKERSLMENLVRIVNGDRIEELPEKHQQVYNIVKDIFGASFSRDWRVYTGADSENGDEILMKGEGKDKAEWDKRSVDEKAETEQIMKVVQLVHNLAQYTPLGNSSNMTPSDANEPKPISLAQGQALLKSMKQAGYVGGILSSGEVSSKLRRYLYERAIDTQKISKMDFALLQHTLDEGVALEPRLVGQDVSIVIPTPEAVNDLLFQQHPENKGKIRQVVKDYRNLVYNRLMGFQGLVTDIGLSAYFSGEAPNIRDIAEGKNVKRMLDLTDFEKYVSDAVMLTSVKSNESKNELRSVVDRLKETEIWSSIDGFLKSMIDADKIDNLKHMKGMTQALRDNLDARRDGLTENELKILNRVHEKAAAHIKVLEELADIDKADYGQTDVNTLVDSKTKLGNAMDALKEILNTNGSWDSRKEMNKLIGDVIQGFGGDTSLKAGIAYARLKRGLLDNIKKGKRGETLEEIEQRYEKEGRFSDFQKIVVKTLTGSFDSLDKDQLEALNKQIEKEAKSYLSGLREIQFTISPNTIARKYGDIFVDEKTKAFSEELKQEILSAYKADIASPIGGVDNIKKVINRMIESVEKKEDVSVADFIIEELPKLLHTLVSTEKKEELRYDDSKKDLKEQEMHGSRGPLDNFMTWWTDTIKDVHETTDTPNIYFSRLSRNAIIDGFLRDIDSKEGFDYEALIRSLDGLSSELTPEAINEANKKFGENSNIEAIAEAAKKRGRAFKFEAFTVDFGGHDVLIDMNGLQESKGDFKEQAKLWYKEKLKWIREEKEYISEEGVATNGNKAAASQFEKAFKDIIKRFDGVDNISFEDARDILRHMYYDFSNKSGHDALFEHGGDVELMMKANANLFKYSIVAQGENAGRLSSKLGEILLDVSEDLALDIQRKHIELPEGRIQGQMNFLQSLQEFRNKDWNFDVSVIADEKVGGVESIFGSRNLVNTVYKEMIEKSLNRILRKKGLDKSILAEAGIDVGDIFDASLKLDKTVTPIELIEKLLVEKPEPIGLAPVGKADIAKEKRRLAKKKKRDDLLKIIKSDVLMNEITNVLSWRKQSLEELTKIDDGTSAMDGVTYLSTSAARVIFGMNGFHIGDGFASVKPVISHNTNSFFDGGKTNETLIGKTNFVYDPRVAEHLDKKGIDIMMGKSAAKSFSGRISEMPLQEGLPIGNIFQHAVDAVDMKNNFKLPIGSIGVIYSARALHPAKVVPVAAIGMSANDSRDYSTYMGLENQIKQLANDAVGLNDYRRTGIINALVNQAKETGYDLDVGGGGLAMELFKIGMDASDTFIKREVKRVFHKARGALIGAVEKPGAGVSVLIPEFDVSLPSYGEVGGNRRQFRVGGKKIPHEMGTRTGLYGTVNDINFIYTGDQGQDIYFRAGDHIDPTKQNFILSAEEGKKGRALSVKEFSKRLHDLVQNTRKEDDTGDLDFRDLSVVDLYQLLSLRFRKDKDGNPMIEELRSDLENAHLHIGSTEEGLTDNVIRILRANFGRGSKFKTSKELYDFTELASELGIGMAVPGLRVPSQSYSDVVISRLEGVYAKSFGNVIGANVFDVFTKHQGDFDVDKMFFYLDAPVSLMHKGIRNAGYNVEPQTPPSKNLQAGPVDLLNNDFKPGTSVSSNDKRDGAAQRRKELVQNKYLIGRTNRLNYSLAMLRETGFTLSGKKFKDKYADSNNFEKITPESEAAMGYMSQRVSNLASLIFDPHKNPHKAAFMKDHEILRWLLFGEWNESYGPSPDKGLPKILSNRVLSKDDAIKGMFPWLDQKNIEREWKRTKKNIQLSDSHREVLKDLYIESINVMGKAGRVFSGIFDETGQRAPEHWEYSDIKDTINRFRKEPTKFLFNRLAWKYRKEDTMTTALFDLMVRYNKGHYGDIDRLASDVSKGQFNYKALEPSFVTHNFTRAANEKMFYELTPALSVLNGISPGDDNKTIYDHADEAVSRERYSNYSGAARDLIDSYIFLRAFSPDVQDITKLWDKAQNRIRAEGGPSEIQKQQQRDILWQVLEKELRSQDGYLKYLKGNKNTSSYDIEVTANRMHRIQSILNHVKNQSLHSDAAKKNLFLEEDYEGGWAKIQIQNGGKRGGWYENRNKQDVVVYEVDIADNITNLANVEYKMLKGGQRLKGTYGGRDPQKLFIGRNQKIVVLKNPIRNISTDKTEFLHGLSAFAASTTLTPESLRVPFEDKDRNLVDQFYNDIDIVKTALKDYGSQLKENLKRNPNDKKMTFAVDGWKINDLMRVLMSKYVNNLPSEIREDRLTDIFELLTMVEPLHGGEARIPGMKDVSIPVFIQNRAVFKGVTGFYLRQLGDEGRVIVHDYVKRKAAFYRAFTDRSGDLDEIEKGFKERLFSQDTRILPRHLKELGDHHRVVNDILYRPLTTFSDFSLRMALNTEFGIRPEQLKRRPIVSRQLVRPWGSTDALIELQTYANSTGTDPNNMFSTARTFGKQARDALKCLAKTL